MNIIYQFIISFFATIGFAGFFGAPMKSILATGVAGALSWVVNLFISDVFNSDILGAFVGALIVGILGEILAVKYKKPATVFITPGIISLVPGAGMYYTMYYLVEDNFFNAVSFGTETFFIAAAIAIGVTASTVFSRSIKSFKKSG